MPRIFSTQIRVESFDLDSFGHVNNSVYLQYLESARCDYMRQVGLSFNDFHKWNALPVVVEVYLRYYYSLTADDLIQIQGTFNEWQRSSFQMEYEIFKEKETRVMDARLKFMFVNKTGKPIRIPDVFQKALT